MWQFPETSGRKRDRWLSEKKTYWEEKETLSHSPMTTRIGITCFPPAASGENHGFAQRYDGSLSHQSTFKHIRAFPFFAKQAGSARVRLSLLLGVRQCLISQQPILKTPTGHDHTESGRTNHQKRLVHFNASLRNVTVLLLSRKSSLHYSITVWNLKIKLESKRYLRHFLPSEIPLQPLLTKKKPTN